MLTKYNLKMPHEIFSGEDALENLKSVLAGNGVNFGNARYLKQSFRSLTQHFPFDGDQRNSGNHNYKILLCRTKLTLLCKVLSSIHLAKQNRLWRFRRTGLPGL